MDGLKHCEVCGKESMLGLNRVCFDCKNPGFPKFEGEARPLHIEPMPHFIQDLESYKADQRSRDRLMLAGQIAAGMLSNSARDYDFEGCAIDALKYADALLAEHERTKETPDAKA